jgi:hypothetical protein
MLLSAIAADVPGWPVETLCGVVAVASFGFFGNLVENKIFGQVVSVPL